ncbi:SDR family oxidoreductase [Actinoplanes derwentensis]|uniref:Phosphopantetheine attachment site n=1 Tax=Actinoplanes derwentensis TaxID=113562 RepID=A0A1H2CIR6_9ACTN|nr:SDR family oxidoreductase [Actinoplanes derwentensis]GID89594.1 hypothetical protein Ade03nite_85180 [Actinoplanes derwentensis]SDT70137.1 Phosphopantetheine attachment site [Actinoplanes derwentensis]
MSDDDETGPVRANDIAVIGMCGRFPGAADLTRLWSRLRAGDDMLTTFTDAELRAAGVPDEVMRDPGHVKRAAILPDAFDFDHTFFGYTRREAKLLDPQQRVLLEVAWELLETVGYSGGTGDQAIGVFAGASMNTYLTNVVARSCDPLSYDGTELMIANDKDYLTTRISYKLGLQGPSVNVQSACSTSLVAVHLAAQSLLAGECDIALAGGVSVIANDYPGYVHNEGMFLSPDGRCRPFDADAAGTTFGDGAGLVALKRLAEAIEDGDQILAVVKGSAINNDGSDKIGFTAPSIAGQRAAIAEAQAIAETDSDTITYVEAHGTATILGDPIEFTALREVFVDGGAQPGRCALGSVKGNVGHLAAAAGIIGFIKVVLALQHREIPGHPGFSRPNPALELAGSPFYINTSLMDWPSGETPRRAGVSSFGFGGTNAHVVLEEAPPLSPRPAPADGPRLLMVSAKSDRALRGLAGRLADALQDTDTPGLADVAHTLSRRRAQPHRHVVTADDPATAVAALRALADGRVTAGPPAGAAPEVTFLFSEIPAEDFATLAALVPALDGAGRKADNLSAVRAVAALWTKSGVRPAAVGGAGAGEVLAACFAGTLEPSEAVALLSWRAGLLDTVPEVHPTAPGIVLLSAVTGGELPLSRALDPGYWTRDVWDGDRLADALAGRTVLGIGSASGPGPRLWADAARLWTEGVPVDWSHWAGGRPRRVPLPAEPLNRVFHRLERKPAAPPHDTGQERRPGASPYDTGQERRSGASLYAPSWQRLGPLAAAPPPDALPAGPWLLFADSGGVGDSLASALRARDADPVVVRHGTAFSRPGTGTFVVDPTDPADYRKLFAALAADGLSPTRVVHLWSLDIAAGRSTTEDLDGACDLGLFSVLDVAKQLARAAAHLTVVARDVHDITGAETVAPAAAMPDAALNVISHEFAGLRCRAVDIGTAAVTPDQLLAEVAAPTAVPVAFRQGQRWTQRFVPVSEEPASRLRTGGTYLITGGLGRAGLVIAGHLARVAGAKLVLTGRTNLPPPEAYDRWIAEHGATDPVSRRIEAVRAVERLGGTVMTASADVTDANAMRELADAARHRFGRIDGWFHCAGVPLDRSNRRIDRTARDTWRAAVAPAVHGASVLVEVFADQVADFGVLMSSPASVLGDAGDAGQAAASRFLDAQASGATGLISVGWDGPAPEWDAGILNRVLGSGLPSRLTVTESGLELRVQRQWAEPDHGGPAVDDLKQSLAKLWSEVLRTTVARYDLSLFDLGGDEFLAVRLARRIEQELGMSLRVVDLLANPTIDQLVAQLDPRREPEPPRRRAGRRTGAV